MNPGPRPSALERVLDRPWTASFVVAAVLFAIQVTRLVMEPTATNQLPTLAPAWQEVAIIPVAFLATAFFVRLALAAVTVLARRRKPDWPTTA